jgi:hypothetical protein
MVNLKQIAPEIHPQPNHSGDEWARWDAYIHTSDPDSLLGRVRQPSRSGAQATGRHRGRPFDVAQGRLCAHSK